MPHTELTDTHRRALARFLRTAAREIRDLRRTNQIMGEKLALVEGILELRTLRAPPVGMAEDVVPNLEENARIFEEEAKSSGSGRRKNERESHS